MSIDRQTRPAGSRLAWPAFLAVAGVVLGSLLLLPAQPVVAQGGDGTATQLQAWTGDYDGWGFPSVAIGTDGLPIVAYNDLSVDHPDQNTAIHNESVKVAHCANVACTSYATSTIAKERADFTRIIYW